ncbi:MULTISPECIES: YcaO-like family protein [unclassified Rhizobium]|uniref:YcaO-like family protein n=1 Tax=unclassified Rhizobium TaxID=2613769 RepID=UPI0009E8EA94|nr:MULTISPECIES: YcaO-like family protein [unclassified Rhizobium]
MRHPFLDRVCSSTETWNRIYPYLGHFGITRVARHTGLDRIGVPVWCAYTPNSRSIVVAQGKGVTDDDARTSAAMEALERSVAGMPAVPTRITDMRALSAEQVIAEPMHELLAVGQTRLGETELTAWVFGHELITGSDAYVPYDAAILDRTKANNRYWMSSDGLASGNTQDEAVLHGILERIERDAFVLWQVTSAKSRYRSCFDPKTLENETVADLVDRMHSANLECRLFDITSDIGIPTMVCFLGPADVLISNRTRTVDVTYGCGTHPSRVKAAIRALTEAAQSRMTYISGARDDIRRSTYDRVLPEETRQAFAVEPNSPICQSVEDPDLASGVSSLLDHVLECLKKAGIPRVIAVPLQAADLPFVAAKVFIPALENPDDTRARRFGPRALAKAMMS